MFDEAGALDKLEAFASFHGPDFQGLPRNRDSVTLVKESWKVPSKIALGADTLVLLRAGETVAWRLADTKFTVLPA